MAQSSFSASDPSPSHAGGYGTASVPHGSGHGKDEATLRRELTEVGHRTYRAGFAMATDGNLSHRLDGRRVDGGCYLISPSGVCLGEIEPEDFVVIAADGRPVERHVERPPSSEYQMHLAIYETREDVDAILHSHPPIAIGLTVAGEVIAGCVLPEVIVGLGNIPTVPYSTPTTADTAEAVRAMIPRRDALMLDRHGSVTVDRTIVGAFRKLEKLEHAAHVTLVAKQMGRIRQLPPEEVSKLLGMRERLGLPPIIPGCNDCGLGCR